MTTQEILENSSLTKTAKMIELFRLGHTRVQVSNLLGVRYGFVQNVWARYYRTTATLASDCQPAAGWSFNKKFGVEIEAFGLDKTRLANALNAAGVNTTVEGYNHTTRSHWKIVTDGSINGAQGFELVSPPLEGQAGIDELNKACQVLKQLGAKINKSCGLHIHFDAAGFTLTDWKRIYTNYASLEHEIDSIVAPSRRGSVNHYCRSMRATNFRTKIENAASLEQIETAITGRNRYFKLNTQSFWRHRTVEFRQHNGTIEGKKITNWIQILAQLLDAPAVTTANWTEFTSILQHEQKTYAEGRRAYFQRAASR